jgi:lysophospholipase L1-like esterase
MKLWRIITGALVLALAGAILASVFLFREAMEYYKELNYVRLDPYGILTNSGTPVPTRQADLPLVLLLGDSRIYDWSLPTDAPFQFLAWGMGGQTTEQVLGRYQAQAPTLQADFVVVQAGINDLKSIPLFPDERDAIVRRTQENLRAIIDLIHEGGGIAIVTTIIPNAQVPLQRQVVWSDAVAPAIREVNTYLQSLADERTWIIDAYHLLADSSGMLRPDYAADFLHLSDDAYVVLNVALLDVLRDHS